MLDAERVAPDGQFLSEALIRETLAQGLAGRFRGQKVLVLIPDHTRSLPLPLLFRQLATILADAARLDFLVALGTHPPLSEERLEALVGITPVERKTTYARIELFNHAWDDPAALATLGAFEKEEMQHLAGEAWHPSLPQRVEVRINRAVFDYDQLLILGPTFPHEVAGFSGGAKYLFPGISGPEFIHASHWLGALSGVVRTIGLADTPVRRMIEAAAGLLDVPLTLVALVVEGEDLSGLFIGERQAAWQAAVALSARRHIRWCEKPFQRALSCAPAMYDELWTCAKAMYKLEPVIAKGGEVIIYAPHLSEISQVHGTFIRQVGYHTLAYFLAHWDEYKQYPLGVLAHATHLRGWGVMEGGVERANVTVTLATRIPKEECAALNLGYLDPAAIDPGDWQGREAEGRLYVARAGEILYRPGRPPA